MELIELLFTFALRIVKNVCKNMLIKVKIQTIQTDFQKKIGERNAIILDAFEDAKREYPDATLCRIASAIAKEVGMSFSSIYKIIKKNGTN